MSAVINYPDIASGNWISWLNAEVRSAPEPPFLFGWTLAVCDDPLNPKVTDNVGWDGDSSGGTWYGDQTIPANTTWSNRIIYGNVYFTDDTSRLENSIIYGSAFAVNKPGLVVVTNGGYLFRCTIWGSKTTVGYWTNGIKHTGGVLTVIRCVIFRVVDCIHTSGTTNRVVAWGNLGGYYSFFDNDLDHASGTPAYWTHNDFVQGLSGVGPHDLVGNTVYAFCDTTDVTWSGITWGSGVASNGPNTVGMPATALNAGYWNAAGKCTWANGFTFSNVSGFIVNLERNWIDGVNASSGMIQFTTGTTNLPTYVGNRFGLGGKKSGSGKIFLISHKVGTVATIGTGADANIFWDCPSVPVNLRNQPLVFTDGGASIVP